MQKRKLFGNKRFKRVCIVDSIYSLLIYLLISGKQETGDTFFFFSDGINEMIRRKFKNSYFISYKTWKTRTFLGQILSRIWLKQTAWFRWPFLRDAEIYGHDHLFISSALVGDRNIIVIEDGIANYRIHRIGKNVSKKGIWIRRKLLGALSAAEIYYGGSEYVKRVILTDLCEIPEVLKEKSVLVCLQEIWKKMNSEDQYRILNYFSLTQEDVEVIGAKDILVLTEPFNNVLTENELIEVYQKMIAPYDKSRVVIKTHPRDTINYKMAFSDICVFDKPVPMELLNFIGIHFEKVCTILSTAVFSFTYPIDIYCPGTLVHQKLISKYGIVTFDDLKKRSEC